MKMQPVLLKPSKIVFRLFWNIFLVILMFSCSSGYYVRSNLETEKKLVVLKKALRSKNSWKVRESALYGLGRLGGSVSLDLLYNALQDPEPRVRIAVIENLKLFQELRENPEKIRERLKNDPDERVRIVALDTLVELGDTSNRLREQIPESSSLVVKNWVQYLLPDRISDQIPDQKISSEDSNLELGEDLSSDRTENLQYELPKEQKEPLELLNEVLKKEDPKEVEREELREIEEEIEEIEEEWQKQRIRDPSIPFDDRWEQFEQKEIDRQTGRQNYP